MSRRFIVENANRAWKGMNEFQKMICSIQTPIPRNSLSNLHAEMALYAGKGFRFIGVAFHDEAQRSLKEALKIARATENQLLVKRILKEQWKLQRKSK